MTMIDRGLGVVLFLTKVVVGAIWLAALVPLLVHHVVDGAGDWVYEQTGKRVWRVMARRRTRRVLRKLRAAIRVRAMQQRIAQAEEFVRGFAGDN